MSTVTSNKTLKANQFETDVDIMNILSSKQRTGLTLNSLMVHTASGRHRYSQNRKETGLLGTEGRRDDKDKGKKENEEERFIILLHVKPDTNVLSNDHYYYYWEIVCK